VRTDRRARRAARGDPSSRRYQIGIIGDMAMTLRLTDEQAEALRSRASREGRSMQQVARSALDDYLMRAEDDEQTDRLAEQGAQRYAELLRRLGE
jgi:plasmid stability protein